MNNLLTELYVYVKGYNDMSYVDKESVKNDLIRTLNSFNYKTREDYNGLYELLVTCDNGQRDSIVSPIMKHFRKLRKE